MKNFKIYKFLFLKINKKQKKNNLKYNKNFSDFIIKKKERKLKIAISTDFLQIEFFFKYYTDKNASLGMLSYLK